MPKRRATKAPSGVTRAAQAVSRAAAVADAIIKNLCGTPIDDVVASSGIDRRTIGRQLKRLGKHLAEGDLLETFRVRHVGSGSKPLDEHNSTLLWERMLESVQGGDEAAEAVGAALPVPHGEASQAAALERIEQKLEIIVRDARNWNTTTFQTRDAVRGTTDEVHAMCRLLRGLDDDVRATRDATDWMDAMMRLLRGMEKDVQATRHIAKHAREEARDTTSAVETTVGMVKQVQEVIGEFTGRVQAENAQRKRLEVDTRRATTAALTTIHHNVAGVRLVADRTLTVASDSAQAATVAATAATTIQQELIGQVAEQQPAEPTQASALRAVLRMAPQRNKHSATYGGDTVVLTGGAGFKRVKRTP